MDLDLAMDPESCLHRDFRSPSIPKQRRRKTLHKYYSYRAVKPSWVGRKYYTLHLVSSTVHTSLAPRKRGHKTLDSYVTHVTEKEEPALLKKLRREHPGWYSFHHLWFVSEAQVAVAQARHADIDSYPIVVPESGSTEPDDPANPQSLERISIEPPGAYPPTMPDNLHLKVQVKTWTKKDNYENSTHFWWGPDIRHSRGKRSCRERHLQKWHDKVLGRGTRNRAARLRWEVDGSCGILRDRTSWSTALYDDWMSDCDTTYWDWDVENWLGTGWWDDDGHVADEGWGWGDRWTERVDRVAIIHKVSEWRRSWCDYEGMAELEGSEEKDGDGSSSIASDVVVLEHAVDVDVDVDVDADADFDKMSDLAEVLVEGEWDVLSEASSL